MPTRKPRSQSQSKSTANKSKSRSAEKARSHDAKLDLSDPQNEFLLSKARFLAYVGGYGSGKSFIGCVRVLLMPAGSRGMILAPSYGTLKDATLKTFWDVLEIMGLPREYVVEFNKTEMRMMLANGTEILWRSADYPDSLRGPSLDWCYLDEGAYIQREAWDIAVSRLRGSVGPHVAWITSTPNGKANWLYKLWVEQASTIADHDKKYHLVSAPTWSNKHLPEGYMDNADGLSDLKRAQEYGGEFHDMSEARLRREWLRFIRDIPKGPVTVGVDLASSTSAKADYTAMVAVVNGKHRQHVVDSARHKLPFSESTEAIADFCIRNKARIVYVESVQYQIAAVQTLSQMLRKHGIIVKAVRPTGNKLQRFLPIEALIQQGLITFSEALIREFIEELLAFTGTKSDVHDDMVDALVYACGGGGPKQSGGVRDIDCFD